MYGARWQSYPDDQRDHYKDLIKRKRELENELSASPGTREEKRRYGTRHFKSRSYSSRLAKLQKELSKITSGRTKVQVKLGSVNKLIK